MNFEEQITLAIETLKDFNPTLIYLFGSASRNELRDDSDVDIAFLSEENIDEYQCFIKAQELAEIFNRDVDLINLKLSSTVFKAQVIGKGRVIFCTNETDRMFFEMRGFKEYAMLNEERAEILKKIKERGSVYGK